MFTGSTLVFDLEVGGDERRGLTSDPRGEWLSALSLVILYYLDLRRRGEDKYITTFIQHKYTHVRQYTQRGTFNTHAGDDFHTTPTHTHFCSY